MNVLIIGCGTFGKSIINALSGFIQPPFITVIDRDQESFGDLPVDFKGFTITGDASNITLLDEAKIKNADIFMAVTQNVNLNLMLTHIAKEVYQVSTVIARVTGNDQRRLGQVIGITTINPVERAAEDLLTHLEIAGGGSK